MVLYKTHNFSLRQITYPFIALYCLVLAIVLSTNTAYAYFAPDFSDCLEEYSEEHDQVDACETLLWSNPERRDLYVALGNVLEKRNKHKKSLKTYQKALLVFPNDSYFLSKLSIVKTDSNGKKDIESEKIAKQQAYELVKQQADKLAKQQADKLAKQQADELAKQQANKLAKQQADKLAKQQADKLAKQQTDKLAKQQTAKLAKQQANKLAKQQTAKLNPKQQEFLEQIKFLKSLKTQQIISQTEYDNRKRQLLDSNFRVIKEPASNTIKVESPGFVKNKASPNQNEDIFKDIDFGNYHALIIGNNQYEFLPKLKTAVNDAETLAKLLKENYGFKVHLLLNANRYNTLKVLGGLRNTLTKKDNLLIYYAGHGVLDEASERGYWLPVDAEKDFKSNWISTAEITDALKALQSWHVLVVADSCYSGTLVRSAPVTFKNPIERNFLIKRLHKKKSRTAITSGGLEPVADSGGDGHSVFAQAFLDILKNNDSIIETEDIFGRLRDKVILNADQTPEYSNVRKVGHNGGDFIFKRQ